MNTSEPVKERKHRLPPEEYLGVRSVAFTACESHRRPVFGDFSLVEQLVPFLEEAAFANGCVVPIYTFMPDHLHVLVAGVDDLSDIFAAMTRFKARSGWWLYRHRPDIRWQKGCWDHVVRHAEGWHEQACYIAANPVRAGLCEDPLAWPFTGSIGFDVREIVSHAFWEKRR